MPYGPGTYGSKVGRPSKKKKANMTAKKIAKKTAITAKKLVKKTAETAKKLVKKNKVTKSSRPRSKKSM